MSTQKIRATFIAFLLVLCTGTAFAQQSANESAVWKLEHSYWEDVKALDIDRYRTLWNSDFVGWPHFSSVPQRKEHITDWLAQYRSKGMRLKSYSLQPLASQSSGDVVLTYYRLAAVWTDKSGTDKPQTTRITHTWLRTPAGWQILGGMSAYQPEDQK